MRKTEQFKQTQAIGHAVEKVRQLDTQKKETASPIIPDTGQCVIQKSIKYGINGCLCDIEILSNSEYTGVKFENAISHDSFFDVGAVCHFSREPSGTINLISGGGSGSGATSYSIVGIILAGWTI